MSIAKRQNKTKDRKSTVQQSRECLVTFLFRCPSLEDKITYRCVMDRLCWDMSESLGFCFACEHLLKKYG